jgi:hypothetical protein
MPGLIVYEIVPAAKAWVLRTAGDGQSEWFDSKAEAIARARELLRRHSATRVRVLRPSGDLEAELSPPSAPEG